MFLIIGLGNPGKEYEKTNHNVGFRVVDEFVEIYGEKFGKKTICDSVVCDFRVNNERIVVAKPQTYMNNSGVAVLGLVKKYNINPATELVVISDDFDIKEGSIRIRTQSGNTTHNGIKSIKQFLKTNEFIRFKVSIGQKPQFMDVADFVLSKTVNPKTKESEEKALSALKMLVDGASIEDVSQKYSN